jgi:predicted ATP-grasp superfamily ATP-dependent carboligase
LPTRCGINIVLMAYLEAIGKKTKYVDNYEEGIKWTNFLRDLASVLVTRTSIKDWARSLKNTREWSYFAGDDFVPWMISNYETAREIAKIIYTHTRYRK